MTKLLPAIFENGTLKPTGPLSLPEHQRVWLAIAITQDDIPALLLSKLAEESNGFQFLNNPQEDIYSPLDGEEV